MLASVLIPCKGPRFVEEYAHEHYDNGRYPKGPSFKRSSPLQLELIGVPALCQPSLGFRTKLILASHSPKEEIAASADREQRREGRDSKNALNQEVVGVEKRRNCGEQ